MRSILVLAAAMLGMSLGVSAPSADGGEKVPRLSTSGSFSAPVGFQIFCLTNRSFCRGGGAEQISLTAGVLATLQSVNGRINSAIQPISDRQDVWTMGASQGDCEDYVLAKRAALIDAGLPASALRIAAATTRRGTGHAVLVVRTDRGDVVLDNLTDNIKPADQTALHWIAMTQADGRTWKRIV